MQKLTAIILILISLNVNGQQKNESLLTVTGAATVVVKPDMGVLNIHVTDINLKMNESIKSLGDKSKYYIDILKKLKFEEKNIKTTSFSVTKNSIFRNDKYIDSGYIATQDIRLEFIYDDQILSKILNEFTKTNKEIDFSFSFKLSEGLKEKVQKQIIELAIQDAKQKANNISISASFKLGKIKNIHYGGYNGNSGMEQLENIHPYAFKAAGQSYEDNKIYNFTPDDLIFKDNILFEYYTE